MPVCKVCQEKDKEIEILELRVNGILDGVKKDKATYQKDTSYRRKEKKILSIALGVSLVLNFLTLAFGRDGVKMLIDVLPNILNKG